MRKKVLFFADGLYGGGAEKVLQTLLQHLDKDKFEITLYSMKQETLNDLYPQDINYHYVFSSCSESASVWKKLCVRCLNKIKLFVYYHLSPTWFYRLFIKGEYDTEVAFIEGYATRIVSGSTNPQSKKIAWVHIDLEQNHWTRIAFRSLTEEQNAYSVFDRIISVSKSVEEATKRLFSGMKETIVLYNPIDLKAIRSQSQCKLTMPKGSACIRLVSVGRYVPQKAFHRLISIVSRLLQLGYNIELLLLGEGSERTNLETQIQSLELQNRVFLLGFQNNPYPFIKSADLFVCSSLTEGYSTVVTEALILEKPVVTTDCAGMRELLLGGKCGLITENNEDALFEGIKSVLDSKDVYVQYLENIKKTNFRFDISVLMDGIESIL